MQFSLGWFAKPILVDGLYPEVMRTKIDAKSEAQGFNESRLPTFTVNETAEISGSADFLGINHYTSHLTRPFESDIEDVSYFADQVLNDRFFTPLNQ